MPKLSGPQLRQLARALVSAYPNEKHLHMMVFYGLGESLDAITTEGDIDWLVFQLIKWAEAQDRVGELLIAARRERPDNTALRAVAEELHLAPATPSQPELERLIGSTQSFINVGQWRERLGELEPKICRVEIRTAGHWMWGPNIFRGIFHAKVVG